MTSVAGGRAKRRKLAQALAERPSVLTDGRSPAPRAVGDLLIALRKAGARAVSPPACTGCGKDLRTMQRRGQDWYCGVCGPVRLPCAACGNTRRVASRDRDEQPRCAQCPPGDGQDPAEIVMNVVAAIDPALPAALVSAAVTAAAARGRAAPPARLGPARPARAAHRSGRPGTGPVRAEADQRALRRRRHQDCPAAMPPVRPGHQPAPADRRAVVVPQLRRQVPLPAVRTVRSRPAGRYP